MPSKKKKTIPLNAAECVNAVSQLIEADPPGIKLKGDTELLRSLCAKYLDALVAGNLKLRTDGPGAVSLDEYDRITDLQASLAAILVKLCIPHISVSAKVIESEQSCIKTEEPNA